MNKKLVLLVWLHSIRLVALISKYSLRNVVCISTRVCLCVCVCVDYTTSLVIFISMSIVEMRWKFSFN